MAESVAVIPARYGSTRFPGKVLASLWGKPLIQHVYERAARCADLDRVVVATDDQRVARAVERFGGTVHLTSADHQTGTDRTAEIADRLAAEVYVNIQGDEPLVEPDDLSRLVRAFRERPELEMATLRFPLTEARMLGDPNVVKVVTDAEGMALLFSRSPIPFRRNAPEGGVPSPTPDLHQGHVGVYAYRRNCLLRIARMPRGRLECAESLEQLRPLEHGVRILVLPASGRPQKVDTPEDLERLRPHATGAGGSPERTT